MTAALGKCYLHIKTIHICFVLQKRRRHTHNNGFPGFVIQIDPAGLGQNRDHPAGIQGIPIPAQGAAVAVYNNGFFQPVSLQVIDNMGAIKHIGILQPGLNLFQSEFIGRRILNRHNLRCRGG